MPDYGFIQVDAAYLQRIDPQALASGHHRRESLQNLNPRQIQTRYNKQQPAEENDFFHVSKPHRHSGAGRNPVIYIIHSRAAGMTTTSRARNSVSARSGCH